MWNREQWMQEREKRDKGRSSRRWEGFACLITLITISRWHLYHVIVDAQRHKHTHTQITSIIPRECNSHSEFNIPSATSGERWGGGGRGGVSEGRQMWALDWGYTALEFLSFFPHFVFLPHCCSAYSARNVRTEEGMAWTERAMSRLCFHFHQFGGSSNWQRSLKCVFPKG